MFKGLTALLALFCVPLLAYADQVELDVCQLPGGVYQFSFTGEADGWAFQDGYDYDLDAMTAKGEGVRFTVFADGMAISIYGYPDVKHCPEDGWKPSAPSILIPADPGIYKLEIQDVYGHWSLVTDNAHPDGIVLSPNGGYVELIGSVGQDTDPDHYRLIEVSP